MVDGRTVVTVAVIGHDFVDLAVSSAGQAKRQIVTLTSKGLAEIARDLRGLIVRIDQAAQKVRLGLEVPAGVSVVRDELLDELAAWQEIRHEALQLTDDIVEGFDRP